MKNSLSIIIILSCLLSGCSKESFTGSGSLMNETREISSFNKIYSEGTFQVSITQGDDQQLTITADDNIMHRVRSSVSNGTLHLYLSDGNYQNIHVSAIITVPQLKEVENSGTGDLSVYNLDGADHFKGLNTGSGTVFLEGNCQDLRLINDGSGHIHAFDMLAENGEVSTIGSGDVEISCISSLGVDIEGSGDVYYRGNPEINVQTEGSGKLINAN